MKRLFFAILALTLAVPIAASAAMTVTDSPRLGLPGPVGDTMIQIQDLRVTYRFDQLNEPGKSVGMIPVQMTAKLHNFGSAQSLEIAIPLISSHNVAPEVASFYANGQEQKINRNQKVNLDGNGDIEAATVRVNLAKEGEVIIDIRLLQPIDGNILPLLFNTASGWKDVIPSGTIEAITPFAPFNWNIELRRVDSDAAVALTYADKSVAYSFQNLIPSSAQDVYWHFANMEALEYFARGNERFQKTQGDEKSYQMMRSGLLDMIPCNGVRMPLASWWRNMYETITLGVISSAPEGQERTARAMELWSDNWHVPSEAERECAELKQRPDKYKTALNQLLMIAPAERSTYANDALKKHDKFVKEMSEKMGDGSITNSEAADLGDDENLSETDRSLLGEWDAGFVNGSKAVDSNTNSEANDDDNESGFVSSTLAAFDKWIPSLTLGSQILLFIFLALILVIIVTFIILRWKEDDTPKAPTVYQTQNTPKKTVAPSFISKNAIAPTKKPDLKTPSSMRDVPVYPPVPNEPRKADSFKDGKHAQKQAHSVTPPVAKQPEKPKSTSFKFEKPGAPKGPVLDEAYQDKKPAHKPADPPWIKKEPKQELIKPSTPPPKPADNNFPWQKKNKDNEQPPGPTVNI
jgi:hypothetical protein